MPTTYGRRTPTVVGTDHLEQSVFNLDLIEHPRHVQGWYRRIDSNLHSLFAAVVHDRQRLRPLASSPNTKSMHDKRQTMSDDSRGQLRIANELPIQ